MKELVFAGICGSLRRQSRNMGLLRKAKEIMPEGSRLEIAEIGDIPFYNQDIEKPESVKKLVAFVEGADGLLFACPEYNYSLAPALKNAMDWLSREPGIKPFYGKPGAIVGAAGGMGSARAQLALRQVCVYLNIRLIDKPEFYSNAFSDSFNADGDLVDAGLEKKLSDLLKALYDWAHLLERGAEK